MWSVSVLLILPAFSLVLPKRTGQDPPIWRGGPIHDSGDVIGIASRGQELLCDLKYQVEALGALVTKLDGAGDAAEEFRHALGGRCSVVSNSGALLKRRLGRAIDAATSVMRFNDAPAGGMYGTRVGLRETVRLGNDKFVRLALDGKVPIKPGVSYVLMGPRTHEMDDFRRRWPNTKIFVLNGALRTLEMDFFSRVYAERWFHMGQHGSSRQPTTGAIGMLVALRFCDAVEGFEMAPSSLAGSSPYNYYAPGREMKASDNSWHSDFEAEHDLWTRLGAVVQAGRVVIPGFNKAKCFHPGGSIAVPMIAMEKNVSIQSAR